MRPHHRTTAFVFALVAVVFAVFFRTLESGFLRWDDDINVFENPHVQGLTAENLRWMFTDFEQAIRYKPLSWLAWALVHEVFGLNPFGYHLANLLLHCANTVLVFLLIRRLLAWRTLNGELETEGNMMADASAAIGALLWAVHPLRVEPVAWVTGLPYGLALLLLLLATLLYLRANAPDADTATRRRDYWLSVAAFALAVLSYPIVLGFIAGLLALDIYPLRRLGAANADLPSVLRDKLPFLALSLLLVAGTVYGRFHVTGSWDKPATLDNFSPFARAMQAFYLWAYYAWKPLLPLDLCPVYPVLMESRFHETVFLFSAFGVLAVSSLLLAQRKVWTGALALWLAHLGLLVPMLGLTERPHYPHDRYAIISGVLWAIAFAALLHRFACRRPHCASVLAGAMALVTLLGGMSWRQTAIWHSDLPFFTDMTAKLRSSHYRSLALMKLGNAHADAEDDVRAIAAYREALQLSPASATFHLHFNLGNALARQSRWAEAVSAFEAALQLRPDHAGAHTGIGHALASVNNLPRAVEHLSRAVQLAPNHAAAHAQLAEVLERQGKTEQARAHMAESERLKTLAGSK